MASPHVAGLVALMAQKDSTLTADEAEGILESTALALSAGPREIFDPNENKYVMVSWGSDATGSGLVNAQAALGLSNNTSNAPGKPGKKK